MGTSDGKPVRSTGATGIWRGGQSYGTEPLTREIWRYLWVVSESGWTVGHPHGLQELLGGVGKKPHILETDVRVIVGTEY